MYLIETIEDYFASVDNGYPVLTEDVFKYAKKYYPELERNVFNEYMTRVCDRNKNIKRYQRGVYYKTGKDGNTDIRFDLLLQKAYLGEGDSIIGYMTGPAFIYNVELTETPSEELVVVTNNYRSQTIDYDNVTFVKPIMPINKDNYKYLQILDILYNKWKVEFIEDYEKYIYDFIIENNYSFEKFLYYSLAYPGNNLQKAIARLTLYGKNK